jgi:hypothetical protein
MKYLKLFESFANDIKIDIVNNIIIEYLLFNSFVKNDIFVERNLLRDSNFEIYEQPTFTFWSRQRTPIFDYVDGLTILMTTYTSEYLINSCNFTKKQAKEIDYMRYVIRKNTDKGVYQAAKKYIEYLRNTPDKKHLLEE